MKSSLYKNSQAIKKAVIKRFIPLFLASLPIAATAGDGPWDGIYDCNWLWSAKKFQGYLNVNGHADGQTFWVPAAVTAQPNLFGYGLGAIKNGVYSGITDRGNPFSFTAYSTGFTGIVAVENVSTGSVSNAAFTCSKIW